MSQRSLHRHLASQGVDYRSVLNEARLEAAAGLLRDGQKSVKEVAHEVGFSTASAFYRAFKRWTGYSPSEYVSGAKGHDQTQELHAQRQISPANNQAFTFCFAMDYLEGEDHTIEKPHGYEHWRSYVPALDPPWTGPLLSWTMCDPKTLGKRGAYFMPNPASRPPAEGLNLWTYRRILAQANFEVGAYASDISLVNWPQNDYWLGDLLTATAFRKSNLASAMRF